MYRSVFINCAPLAHWGTTISLLIVATATIGRTGSPITHLARSAIIEIPTTSHGTVSQQIFEPPDDSSPDRTSGLGSRSSRQGVSNA